MNRTSLWIFVLIMTMAVSAIAQPRPRAKRAGRPASADPTSKQTPASNPTAAATPAPTPTQPAPSINAPVLAVVDNVQITSADIEASVHSAIGNDPEVSAFYQDREKAIRDARQRAVDARVSSMLMAAEAKKRGLALEEFLAREVTGRTPAPTDAEVRAVYDANRAQFGGTDLEAARPTIVNYLRNERSTKAYGDLVNRLKMTNTVQKGADVNAPNLAPGTVLASVNGQPLRIEAINERMKAYIYKLDRQIYEAQKRALDRRINDTLILAEANKKNIGPEVIIRTEITDKLKAPSETEIAKFYQENKAQINGDLASTRGAIANYLQEQQQQKLEEELAARLRAGAKLQMFLQGPVAPVFNVAVGKGISRGDTSAPVKIVEFTDFQCSACGAMYPVIEEVLKAYGNRVYFEVRNFPLSSIHENAFEAAQAAAAANAQGKFWPYIDLLFKNQKSLDTESLKKFATQAGLDRARFDADLASGKFAADIRRDIEEGEQYGIEGTPTIFINGVVLTTLSTDGLREAIDKGLARAVKRNNSSSTIYIFNLREIQMKRSSQVVAILGAMVFSAFFAANVSAQTAPVGGVYENFTVGKESGDLVGMRVMIIPAHDTFYAMVQIAQGGAEDPKPEFVDATVKGNTVEFTVGDQKYTGTVTVAGFRVKDPDGKTHVLKRRPCATLLK